MGKFLMGCAFGVALILSPLVMFGQDQGSGSSMHSQTVTATGCLQKGQEPNGYYLKDENGKDWELTGVGLPSHVGHKVTVTGHEMQGSKSKETKLGTSEKSARTTCRPSMSARHTGCPTRAGFVRVGPRHSHPGNRSRDGAPFEKLLTRGPRREWSSVLTAQPSG